MHMKNPLNILEKDPIPTLIGADYAALSYFVQRDLQDENVKSIRTLWSLPEPTSIIGRQLENGAWRYRAGSGANPYANYNLLETYRQLGILIEMYGLNRQHRSVSTAAEYIFSCQSDDGAITGILGTQYMPYYQGAIMELLIKAGYEDDNHILKGFEWLLVSQQDDGGWLIPMQTVKEKPLEIWNQLPVRADPTSPSSHLATGMVLRAFAVHPQYRSDPAAWRAGDFLKSRFLKPDKYNDRRGKQYWTKFQYPFWWTNLLTAVDSLTLIGFDRNDIDVQKGIAWFIENQENDGLWDSGYGKGKGEAHRLWVGLAVCRVIKRVF
jgi:hypothetical protein